MYFNLFLLSSFLFLIFPSSSSYSLRTLYSLRSHLLLHLQQSKLSELAGLIVISPNPGWLLSELPALLILRTYSHY